MAEAVKVSLGARSYEIHIGAGVLAQAGGFIRPVMQSADAIIVSDETVARLYLHRLTGALEEQQIRARAIILPPGEATKNIEQLSVLLDQLLEQRPDRRTAIIALGGGVIGDIAGFAASVLLRGVDFIQIPTTLLSQVDSSVGGKTGINTRHGKNLIGAFYQPKLVLIDTNVLQTLPKREWRAGYAEIVKYALIRDGAFFAWLEQNAPALLAGDTEKLACAIHTSCTHKAQIVASDEREGGVRALLNFGHTFAHAMEAELGYDGRLLHGEAVAIGMILALKLSVHLGHCSPEVVARAAAHFKVVGLPTSLGDVPYAWNVESLLAHMRHDKKSRDGTLTFILERAMGDAFIASDVPVDAVRAVLQAP